MSSDIAVNADGSVAAYFGKMDMGHGLHVAIAQIVAEELDVPFKSVRVFMADTATSVNQGGASGSTGIQLGGKQMRVAAAEARRVLVEMAAGSLSIPADRLVVNDGVVSAVDMTRPGNISYAQLIGGQYFNVQLDWNKQYGNALTLPARRSRRNRASTRSSASRSSAKTWRRKFSASRISSPTSIYMMHGRMIRPAVVGAVPVKVDDSAIRDIPGARVVWDKGFLGVVADKEWDAI